MVDSYSLIHSLDLQHDFALSSDPETWSSLVNISGSRTLYPGVEKSVSIVIEPAAGARTNYLCLDITKLFYLGQNFLKFICV